MNWLYGIICFLVALGSYGFIDPNLTLSSHPWVNAFIEPLFFMVYHQRYLTAGLFTFILCVFFGLYIRMLFYTKARFLDFRSFFWWILPFVCILIFSYPMLSYDLFNYMTTAKVAYTYHENPYVVMPIEIPNDQNLLFTRAANKVALYGPTWLLLTWAPHAVGMGNIWQTIIAFKLLTASFYLLMCYLIWVGTKKIQNVLFFALNPLVLFEILVSGHNDIVMMVCAIGGVLLWQKKQLWHKCLGIFFLVTSFLVKGASIVFLPFLFFRKASVERLMFIVSGLLFMVFIILAPLREELYPWYAVWFITTVSFLPYKTYTWVWSFVIALTFGLELRHVPYMAMGYYEGPGPMWRMLLTIVPIGIWGIWYMTKISNFKFQISNKIQNKKNSK